MSVKLRVNCVDKKKFSHRLYSEKQSIFLPKGYDSRENVI